MESKCLCHMRITPLYLQTNFCIILENVAAFIPGLITVVHMGEEWFRLCHITVEHAACLTDQGSKFLCLRERQMRHC